MWETGLRGRTRPLVASVGACLLGLGLTLAGGASAANAGGPCGASGVFSASGDVGTCLYDTAGQDTFTAPVGVTAITIDAFGAQGGESTGTARGDAITPGGEGAHVHATLATMAGATLQVFVGGAGATTGGVEAGGVGGGGSSRGGGGGGGASDVRVAPYGLAARVIVAAGGGGAGAVGFTETTTDPVGGAGGASGGAGGNGAAGGPATAGDGGSPGDASGGGSGGVGGGSVLCPAPVCTTNGEPGTLGEGGSGAGNLSHLGGGGGGGGGYYGGGAGGAGGEVSGGGPEYTAGSGGGGGGSSYVVGSATDASTHDGVRAGNGEVAISFAVSAPEITSPASVSFKAGQPGSFTMTATGVPVATLSESGALPAGVTFADAGDGTAALVGAPAVGTGGSYPITISATNDVAPDATQGFVLTVQGPPTASISTPTAGGTYTAGQVLKSSFGCQEGAGGPGLASCVDQAGMRAGAPIDTSTAGEHTFTVTATSQDGLTAIATVSYTVTPLVAHLSDLRVKPHAFRAARTGRTIGAANSRGATISYRNAISARTVLRVYRVQRGIKRGHRCVVAVAHRHLRRARPCSRRQLVGTFDNRDRAGENRLRFTGRIGGKALRPGRYVITISVDGSHGPSPSATASFTVLPPRVTR